MNTTGPGGAHRAYDRAGVRRGPPARPASANRSGSDRRQREPRDAAPRGHCTSDDDSPARAAHALVPRVPQQWARRVLSERRSCRCIAGAARAAASVRLKSARVPDADAARDERAASARRRRALARLNPHANGRHARYVRMLRQ